MIDKVDDKKEEIIDKKIVNKVCLGIGCVIGYMCIAVGVMMTLLILSVHKF